MFTFTHGPWHCWQALQFMVSNENTKLLLAFATTDDAINYLYMAGEKETSRALHRAVKSKGKA